MGRKRFAVTIDVLKLNSIAEFNEIVLKVRGRRVFPAEKKFYKVRDVVVPINLEIEIDNPGVPLLVELCEFQYLLPDEYVGLFKLEFSQNNIKLEAKMANQSFATSKATLIWSFRQITDIVYAAEEQGVR